MALSSLPNEDEGLVLSSSLDMNDTLVSLILFNIAETLSPVRLNSSRLSGFLGYIDDKAEELGSCMTVSLVVLPVLGVFLVFAFGVSLQVILTETSTFLLSFDLLKTMVGDRIGYG